jgi:hypothetical protein
LNQSPGYRRHAAWQILARLKAIAAVCALPDTNPGRIVYSTNLQLRTLESLLQLQNTVKTDARKGPASDCAVVPRIPPKPVLRKS